MKVYVAVELDNEYDITTNDIDNAVHDAVEQTKILYNDCTSLHFISIAVKDNDDIWDIDVDRIN